MSTQKRLLLLVVALTILSEVKSQGVGIGVETPNPNAVLELVSPGNNQGLLVPKLTTAQRTASSFTNNLTANENGLLVYDTNEDAFYFWMNSQWMSMQTSVNVTAGNGIQIVDGEISNAGDLDETNELQNISLSGNQLSITDGSTIDLGALDTNTQLSEAEVDAFVSNNGYIETESDPSVPANLKDGVDWNEIASIPADLTDGDDNTQLTEAEVDAFVSNNGFLSAEVDGSVTNEIQNLELDGSTLRITNNASATAIDLAPFSGTNTDEQYLSFDGSNINISNGTGIDVSSWDKDASDDFDGDFSSLTNIPAGVTDGDDVDDADADPSNEIQDLELDGNTLRITNNASATDIDLAPFSGTNTDNQTLSLEGTDLSIAGGNTIDISSIDTNTQLNETEVDAFVANNGYLTSEVDGSATNEIQTLNQVGQIVTLSDGGGSFTLPVDTDTQLDETAVDAFVSNNGYLTAEVDGSITNEIQDLELDGSTLRITNNASATDIDLSPFSGTNTDSQTISLVGTNLSITGGNTIDVSSIDTDTQLDDADIAAFGYIKIDNDTDDQIASEVDVTPAGNLGSDNVQSALEELQSDINTLTAGGSDGNDFVTSGNLAGTDLTLTIPNQTNPVIDLSGLQDGTGTDSQDLSVGGGNLNISGGTGVSLAAIQDGFEANTDEQDLSLSGNTLSLTNDATPVDLSGFMDNTDNQDLRLTATQLQISGGNSVDVTNWDLDDRDDLSIPIRVTDTQGAALIDLTNRGAGSAAIFDIENSSSTVPALEAHTTGDGPVVSFDHSSGDRNDIIAEFKSEGNNVVTIRDDGRVTATSFVGNGSGLTGLPSSPWSINGNDLNYTAGNVGIGTSSPGRMLTVQNTTASSTVPLIAVQDQTGSGDAGINFNSQGGEDFTMGLDDSQNAFKVTNGSNLTGNDLVIDGSGNVGVGTSSLFNEMVVSGTNSTASTNDGIMLDIQNISGINGTLTGIRFKKNGVTTNQRYNSAIFYDGNDLMFATKPNTATNVATTDAALIIDEDGNTELNGNFITPATGTAWSVSTTSANLGAPTRRVMRIRNTNGSSVSSVATIGAGEDGQELLIIVDEVPTNSPPVNRRIQFICANTYLGSPVGTGRLLLSGDWVTLSGGGVLHLIYDSQVGGWVEISHSNNQDITVIN